MRASAGTRIRYRIHRADGSVQDHAAVPLDWALTAARTHNWAAEKARLVAVAARGDTPAAPGISFMRDDGERRVLQAFPTDQTWTVDYHYTANKGLWAQEARTAYRKDCSWIDTEFAIRAFFNGRHDQLLNALPGQTQ